MSVTLFTLWVDDPEPVSRWLDDHAQQHVARNQAAKLPAGGWTMWIGLDDADLSSRFQSDWTDVVVTYENHRRWMAEGRYLGETKG